MPSREAQGLLLHALDGPALIVGAGGAINERNAAAEGLLTSLREGADGAWLAGPVAAFLADEKPRGEFVHELPDPRGVRRLRVRLLRHPAFPGRVLVTLEDLSEAPRLSERQGLMADILGILNRQEGQRDAIRSILARMKAFTGIEAIGIRLQRTGDYPYYVTRGFPEEFVRAESRLCARSAEGGILRDSEGAPVLECMCGNVIRGRTDPACPFFTERGSFWTNNTTKLLASTSEEDRQAQTRNRCSADGYESVALIPLRCGDEMIGLLQLNDHRPDMFTLEDIEFFERVGAGVGVALGRGRAESRTRRVARMLAVLRDVHREIDAGGDKAALLRKVCEGLARGLGWGRTWITLTDGDEGEVIGCEKAAFPSDENASPPPCAECEGRRVAGPEQGSRSVVTRIGHGEHVYGVLGLEVPHDIDLVPDERQLLQELADHLAHALLRVDLEEAEREAAVFLRQLLDAIPAPVFYKDAEGVYLGCNRAFEETFDLLREELRGKTAFDMAPREIAERYREMDEALFANPGVQSYESVIRRPGGERRDVIASKATFHRADGSLGGLVGVFIDITERKQNEARYRALVENQVEAVCRWLPDTTLTYANEACRRLLGLPSEGAVGRRIAELAVPTEAAGIEAHLSDLRDNPRVMTYEYRALLPGGETAWIEWTDCPIFGEGGRLVEFQSVGRDVTERRRAEQMAREAEALRATRALASGVAHNFNNLMSGILGFGSLIEGRLKELGEPLDDCRKLAECVGRAARLSRDLLDWTSDESRSRESIPLSEFMRSARLQIEAGLPANVALASSCRRGEVLLNVSTAPTLNALCSICRNAIEAMPEGGELTLAADGEASEPPEGPGRFAEVCIADTGQGMDPRVLPHIFEPFFSTKHTVGVGLSLPLARRAVEQSDGHVRVESEPGKGTTFRVYLPLAEESAG